MKNPHALQNSLKDELADCNVHHISEAAKSIKNRQNAKKIAEQDDADKYHQELRAEDIRLSALEHQAGSIFEIIKDHPIAEFIKQVASSRQVVLDSTTLVGLSMLSGAVGMAFRCKRPSCSAIPVGLYAVAAQPPGARKSAVISAFSEALFGALINRNAALKEQLLASDDNTPAESMFRPFVSDATAESVEEFVLRSTEGFFAVQTDEQTMLDTLFRRKHEGSTGEPPSFLTQGFEGGYVCSSRVTRKGFSGNAHGAMTVFAQEGAIATILSAGVNVRGMFQLLEEATNVGFRQRPTAESRYCDPAAWEKMGERLLALLPAERGFKRLRTLKISEAGHDLLDDFAYMLEPQILPGQRFCSEAIQLSALNAPVVATKISAVLHAARHLLVAEDVPADIGLEDIDLGILLAEKLLDVKERLLLSRGLLGGNNAEKDAVLAFLGKQPGFAFPASEAVRRLRNLSPFRSAGPGGTRQTTSAISDVLRQLVVAGVISGDVDGIRLKTIRLNR